jgi:phenol hydroxylase P0 protein
LDGIEPSLHSPAIERVPLSILNRNAAQETKTHADIQQPHRALPRANAPGRMMTGAPVFDPAVRYVRIVNQRADGMVEFEFAVGEPELFVEMVMPRAEFEQFCRDQKVRPTRGPLPSAAAGSDAHEWDWSLRAAREKHFRHEP